MPAVDVRQAFAEDLPTLTAWSQREGVAPTEGPVFVARDAGGQIVGVLAAAVLDDVAVVLQAAGPDDVQAALLVALRGAYKLQRL
jgi:hypothetical protein